MLSIICAIAMKVEINKNEDELLKNSRYILLPVAPVGKLLDLLIGLRTAGAIAIMLTS